MPDQVHYRTYHSAKNNENHGTYIAAVVVEDPLGKLVKTQFVDVIAGAHAIAELRFFISRGESTSWM